MKSKIHKDYSSWENGLTAAHAWLKSQGSKYKMLFEQNRNMGDTLHLTPIIRHYRNLHPDAAIAFVVGTPYGNAHEFNPHINKLFLVPNLIPNLRIQMRQKILTFNDIDKVVAPSIFPYGSIWKELNWSHPNIADQYFHNAGIKGQLNGGRKLVVVITEADKRWAQDFIKQHKLNPKMTCALEYNSYSARPKWSYTQFAKLASHLKGHGINCVSIAGKKERPIAGTVSALGISWRQSVALLDQVGCFVGAGSGITMLAAAADNPPLIFEAGVPDSVSMKGCQYAPSINFATSDMAVAARKINHFVRKKP